MKICCDLCGGTLQMNAGCQDALCLTCGMSYTMERLRRMLNEARNSASVTPTAHSTPAPTPASPVVPQQNRFAAPQFVMQVTSAEGNKLTGIVQQGGVGVGDTVYINNDYAHPYRVLGDAEECAVRTGGTELWMRDHVPEYIMRNARIVTGVPNAVESAYNYPTPAVREYMEKLLRREFPDFQLEIGVPCNGVSIPVTFLLSKNSRPTVAVFVIDIDCSQEVTAVKKAAQILAPYDIGVTHFIESYRNDAPYVVERIRSAMK